MSRAAYAVILSALLTGCGEDPVAPVTTHTPQLQGYLTVEPAVVAAGEPFTVTLALENHSDAAVRITSGCSASAVTSVERAGQPVLFNGVGGCWTVQSTHWIGPKETRVWSWHPQAEDHEGRPAEPGAYTFVVDFQTRALEDARVGFTVQGLS